MTTEIKAYNENKTPERQAICDVLYHLLSTELPNIEHKLWHGAPVWFIAGNPIVGYHNLKNGIRLLFWSGQSFDEPGLKNEGTFKAAGVMYTGVAEVNSEAIRRWVEKAQRIQWDYKNLMNNKKLVKLSPNQPST